MTADGGPGNPESSSPRGGERPMPPLPRELVAALSAAPGAQAQFDALTPSHRREYVRWVQEARRKDARERRAAQTVMRLLEQA
ncbi:MAG: hypothetical protein JWM25_1941 [Thermoleophilia bacterium]|nr:hypothetical protein [Thermoleophilia bacterium]MCZ4497356.1 hypothetical protein [Thermoleophilia bacterium]